MIKMVFTVHPGPVSQVTSRPVLHCFEHVLTFSANCRPASLVVSADCAKCEKPGAFEPLWPCLTPHVSGDDQASG